MKKLKSVLSIVLVTLMIGLIIYGIMYIKYRIWRAEHPQTKT